MDQATPSADLLEHPETTGQDEELAGIVVAPAAPSSSRHRGFEDFLGWGSVFDD